MLDRFVASSMFGLISINSHADYLETTTVPYRFAQIFHPTVDVSSTDHHRCWLGMKYPVFCPLATLCRSARTVVGILSMKSYKVRCIYLPPRLSTVFHGTVRGLRGIEMFKKKYKTHPRPRERRARRRCGISSKISASNCSIFTKPRRE